VVDDNCLRQIILGAAFKNGDPSWPTGAWKFTSMAKAKKSKPRDHQVRWTISLIKATPAKYLGRCKAGGLLSAVEMTVQV
jgi:hypothetical protein